LFFVRAVCKTADRTVKVLVDRQTIPELQAADLNRGRQLLLPYQSVEQRRRDAAVRGGEGARHATRPPRQLVVGEAGLRHAAFRSVTRVHDRILSIRFVMRRRWVRRRRNDSLRRKNPRPKDGKTPAMRLGMARGPVAPEQIIYFGRNGP
jgi:hypothetical protein